MEVQTVLIDYLADIKHLGAKSQIGYQQRLTVFADWCSEQGVQLEQVNNRKVQMFLIWLKADHKPHKKEKRDLSSHTLAGGTASLCG